MLILWNVLAAVLFAELGSGIFHWWEDRYGNPDWPVIGKWIIQPNIEHHRRPALVCQNTWWDRNNTTLIPSLFGAGLALWLCLQFALPLWWLVLGFVILGHMNEVHSWTHQKCSLPIRFLQSTGLLQSCQHHKIHHERPYNRNYCALTVYLNPVLETLGFWTALEFIVRVTLGASPRPEREIF
jgi:plasmanylethanolamine desaturase